MILGALVLSLGACVAPPPPDRGVLTVSKEQTAAWVRNFNPMSLNARFPTPWGIYEPLLIHNPMTDEWVPWLAEDWAWRDDTTLSFTLRDGVQWSDGQDLEVDDVKYTFDLVLGNPALDMGGLGKFLDRVEAEDRRTVVFHFSRPYGPGLGNIAQKPIVPEHILRDVADPLLWTNPDPVATGPFTEVRLFRSQVYELGRNPNYWGGEVAIEALRFPAIGSNDQAAMSLIQGEIDWAGNSIPDIDNVYVARDPEHFRYWFPEGPDWFLYANTTRPPFDDVRVRKALSMALDRELLIRVAMYEGFVKPASGSGLSSVFESWRSPEIEATNDWVHRDLTRANRLLDEVGLARGPDGMRRGVDGKALSFEFSTVSGWSDAVRFSQVAAQNLRELGLDVYVRSYDPGAWFGRTFAGDFDLTTGWSNGGPTPYLFYRGLMGSEEVQPVGTAHWTNWQRYGSPAADAVLQQFEVTTDPAAQHALMDQLQRRFVEEAPAIPLFPAPTWGVYNTQRFVGWPSAEDPYAPLSPNLPYTPLLVLTQVRPRSLLTAQLEPPE